MGLKALGLFSENSNVFEKSKASFQMFIRISRGKNAFVGCYLMKLLFEEFIRTFSKKKKRRERKRERVVGEGHHADYVHVFCNIMLFKSNKYKVHIKDMC